MSRKTPAKPNPPYPRDVLMCLNWMSVAARLDHFPSRREYSAHGLYKPEELMRRFGPWPHIPQAISKFASVPANTKLLHRAIPRRRTPRPPGGPPRPPRVLTGDPLNFGGMRNTPVNETGVIFLFGVLAGRLGFQIESLQSAFPDCIAKRRIRHHVWETLRVEFEYESRNFRSHGHPVEGCDLIVCWVHNWAECPKNLEVIALSDEVKRLAVCG